MNHPRLRLVLLVLAMALALSACRRHRAGVYATQSVSVGGAQPITVSHRHYRNLLRVAARDMSCHPNGLAPQEVSQGIFSIQGCGLVREYVMVCRGRRRHCEWVGIQPVEQVAVAETRCGSGQVQLAVTGPLTRSVIACGQSLSYALMCGPAGCGWGRGAVSGGVMMQTEPGTAMIVVPDDGSVASVQVPEPPQAQATVAAQGTVASQDAVIGLDPAAGAIQGMLAQQIAAIRACTGGQSATLRVVWSAQGIVTVGLAAPHAGTPIESCVQQAVGSIQLQGVIGPGEVQAQL
jgi:hypothetical protein